MSTPIRSSLLVPQNVPVHQNEPADNLYRAYFFGPFRVIRGNQPLGEPGWRRNKAKSLLKWFLLNPGRMFSADQLVELFWPGIARATGLRNLHVAMNYLRHELEPDLLARQESTFIHRNRNNFYWFELTEHWWSDTLEIHHHYMAAKEAIQHKDSAEVVSRYRIIVRYCSRGFLPEDAYEDVFTSHRRQYDHLFAMVLEGLIHLCTQLNMLDELFIYSQQALLVNPYCEAAIKAIINLSLQQGNISVAIRKLDSFQHLLKEELGIEPGEDILALRKSISASLSTHAVLPELKR